MLNVSYKLISFIIHVTRHFIHYHIHLRLSLIGFGIGLIELGVGQKMPVSCHFIIIFICG